MIRFHFAVILFVLTTMANGQSLETIIQKGHELAILTVSINPDSNLVASGCRDKNYRSYQPEEKFVV